jgi:hypothetical protein
MYRTVDWDSTLAPCLRHVSVTLTQPPRSSLTTKEYLASPWRFLPSLVCAQNFSVAVVLTKTLLPCVAKIIQVQSGFPVQERWSPNTLRPPQWGEDASPLGEGASEHLFWMERSWMSAQIVRNKTPKDHRGRHRRQKQNCLSKAKFTSAEVCAGTWAQHAKGVTTGLHLYPQRSGALFLYSDWSGSCTVCSWLANTTLGIWGWGR